VASNEPGFSLDKLLTTQDLLPRQQLQNALRGGISDAQLIEQYIQQTFAYMVGFQPATTTNGLIVPTLLSCTSDGNLNVNATYVAADPTLVENHPGTVLDVKQNGTYLFPPLQQNYPGLASTQSETNAANAITIPAVDATLWAYIIEAEVSITGSGVMPTAATPLSITITSAASTIWTVKAIAGGKTVIYGGTAAGLGANNVNEAMTVTVPDGGANVTTDLNISYLYFSTTV
jgi:hypothetical protein